MAARIEEITIYHKKEKSLKYSIKGSSFASIMTGFGQYFVSPFALALNATNTHIALLTSIPNLLSSLSQLLAAKITDIYKKRKNIVLSSVLIQALVCFPLFLIPYLTKNVVLLIVLFTIYSIAGSFFIPAWNSWIGDLVDENKRGRFFGLRNKMDGFFSFTSIFAAGYLLNKLTDINLFIGFGVIFGIATIVRLISYGFLKKIYEPRYIVERKDHFSFFGFIKNMKNNNYGRFVLFIFFYRFAVNISSPFFTVYMLRYLNFSYWTFTIITGAATMTSFLTMTYWGKYGDRFGNKKILTVSSLLTPVLPILWVFSSGVFYLIVLQMISGFIWAGFNLSSANFIFDSVKASKRVRCNAYLNVFNGSAIFLGALFGGFLANNIPKPHFFVSNLLVIFVISGILRLFFALMFLPKIEEKRKVKFIPDSKLFLNVVAVDPIKGLMYESVTGMKRISDVGGFGFKSLKKGVKTLNKLLKDLDKAIKKKKKLKEKMKFVPSKEKKFEAKEFDYMIKDLNKKIKRIKDFREDYINEPE